MSDQELDWLVRAQQGDQHAFTPLVESYHARVFNLCYRILGNRMEAEDAAQETFLRAYRAIRRYDPTRPFATWLLTIATRYCIDQLRRRRLPLLSIDAQPRPEVQDPGPNPATAFDRAEHAREIQVLLQALQPVDRAAVVMRYWYEFSYEEIAGVLKLSVSAVKSRLHRARRELARHWQESREATPATERSRYESSAV